jgi:threonine dehydrogenase-like Zn-dependent dehydrogenase
MKAAVIYQKGEMPQYTDFPEPIAQDENELLITVSGAPIKNHDRSMASGTHYTTTTDIQQAKVIVTHD